MDTADDAGVYQLTEDIALIQTVDFFTPIVDDPYTFGQIAAANALSDIYAMGGKPLTVMNIVGFPPDKLSLSVLGDILRGGADKVREAGAVVVGGHSVQDPEPKYGLSVTGIIHPKKVRANSTAKDGDRLVLTKPLGIGIITTAIKAGVASQEAIDQAVLAMTTLNKDAAEVMQEIGVNACTDITGFGLLGHALEMAKGSGVGLRLFADCIPVIEEAWEYADLGAIPAGTRANLEHVSGQVVFHPKITTGQRLMFADAITSGGLLISVPAEKTEVLVEALNKRKVLAAAVIGEVLEKPAGKIFVV